MACSPRGYKVFLVCCNVTLSFIGLSVLILGAKMLHIFSVLLMIEVPQVSSVINAVIAAGFFILTTGVTGVIGVCNESLSVNILYLFALVFIVIMQFSLGVTILVIKSSIEAYVISDECNKSCAATLDSLVLDYALPSAGLMMTIIVVEGLMLYCAVQLFLYIRDKMQPSEPNSNYGPMNATFMVENMPMGTVPASELSPRQMHSPRMDYLYAPPNQPPPGYSVRRSPSPTVAEQEPPTYVEASRLERSGHPMDLV